MEKKFIDDLRQSKITSPIKDDFCIKKWLEYPIINHINDADSKTIHNVGTLIYYLINSIAFNYENQNTIHSDLNNEFAIQYLVGKTNSKMNNFHAAMNLENASCSVSIVDAIFYALKRRVALDDPIRKRSTNFKNLEEEITLSSLYNCYIQLWQGVLFDALEFKVDEHNKEFIFYQKNNNQQLASFISQSRRLKNVMHWSCPYKTVPPSLLKHF